MEIYKTLNEIIVLRAIACLCVVMLHAIKFIVGFEYNGGSIIDFILLNIAGLLSFGTAAFVFISELLLAYSSPNKIKKNFYEKRIKLILIPFISMAIFYGIAYNLNDIKSIPIEIITNLLGNYHGWFILVIFQFYILHHLMVRFGKQFSMKNVLIFTFITNIIYLAIFNFSIPPSESVLFAYFWDLGFQRLFLAWIFYFSVAYYIGRNYEKFIKYIMKYEKFLYLAVILSASWVFINNIYFDFGFGSKRFDMIFFTIFLLFAILVKLHNLGRVPKLLKLINDYSFGIYLIHYFYLHLYRIIIYQINIDFGLFAILILFVLSIISSIVTVYLVNRFRFGKYLVGRINKLNSGQVSDYANKKVSL